MKTLILSTSLVVVFFLGLQHKEPNQEQEPASGKWIGWKNKHNIKPWELTKK